MSKLMKIVVAVFAVFLSVQANERPNIILILSDDQGYEDLGCYGAKDLDTPVIDALAENGIRFTDGYVTAPQCTPSRCGLITGVHQQRMGLEANPDAKYNQAFGFQDGNTTTIAGLLKEAGYRTGIVGKWHLGEPLDSQPFTNGFEWCRYMRKGMGYFWPARYGRQELLSKKKRSPGWWGDLFRNEKDEVIPWEEGYITDVFTDYALEFVTESKEAEKPFFLYLAYNAPHWPMEAPEEIVAEFAFIKDPVRRIYAAMIKSMDTNIGRLVERLEALGIREDTLIVFLSDNGAPGSHSRGYNAGSNEPLKGCKGMLTEGGVRIPMIASWPARFKSGEVSDRPVISLDWTPTFLSAAGAEIPSDKDGHDLLSYLSALGKENAAQGESKPVLHWRYLTQWATQYAIRDGDWKLVSRWPEAPQLYQLGKDIGETNNLSEKHPEVLKRLQREIDQWSSELPERPKWIDQLHRDK